MAEPLDILFIWHMHQPYYKDPLGGEYALPWTYLHAIKDYYDMAAIVAETPGARAVFNLVPSLLEQLEEYAAGTAIDPILQMGQMDPSEIGEEELLQMLDMFFSANRQRMIEPHPRYLELLLLAGDDDPGNRSQRLRSFRRQEIIDLQVCFFLSWTGEAARRRWPAFRELLRKGRHYTLADRDSLFALQREVLSEIIPLYRQLHDEGKAELSVSPYYHPILPLLCDMKIATVAMPRANLPTARFRHPEDARSQIIDGLACFQRIFGFTPAGMWPSEGSVSDEALRIIASCGLQWVASDEGILVNTLPGNHSANREALYHPYAFAAESSNLNLIFRDHALSDLIGFTYSQWEPERAVSDFVDRLRQIRREFPSSRLVPVILDGENAWEYYQENGFSFLSRLYGVLAESPEFHLTTASEAIAAIPPRQRLTRIHPGSWINANYGIWVGHPEENVAWDYLERARETAVNMNPQVKELLQQGMGSESRATQADETAREICRALFAAEGSDWFWWYGDDHFSAHSDRFDGLFRRHLMHVYRLLGLEVPRELYEPIKKKREAGFIRQPVAFFTPALDGLATDYFEWQAGGLYDLSRQSSAMHASESLLQSFFYGYDNESLHFRIDGIKSLDQLLHPEDILRLHLVIQDREYLLAFTLGGSSSPLQLRGKSDFRTTSHICPWRLARVCEARIPLSAINPTPGTTLKASITLLRDGDEVGRWPVDAPMDLTYLGQELELDNWLI